MYVILDNVISLYSDTGYDPWKMQFLMQSHVTIEWSYPNVEINPKLGNSVPPSSDIVQLVLQPP